MSTEKSFKVDVGVVTPKVSTVEGNAFAWASGISNIVLGTATYIVLSEQIFGDPWSGQVVIENVAQPTEADNTFWYQATDGNTIQLFSDFGFTVPVDSSTWLPYTGGGYAYTANYQRLELNASSVGIVSNNGDYNPSMWSFNTDGSTEFPTLATARGDISSGTISGETLRFGQQYQEAIITTKDGDNAYPSSQRLVINPGKGADNTNGEGGDIYLWAGRGGSGDVGNAIAAGTGGDIKIRGGFGPLDADGGYIRMEGGEAAGLGAAGYIEAFGGYSATGNGGDLRLGGGYGGGTTGGNVDIDGGYGANYGGNVRIVGGVSGSDLSKYGNVYITSGPSSWAFDNFGNLTLPTNSFTVNYANGTQVPLGSLPLSNGTSNFDIATVDGDATINVGGNTWTFSTGASLQVPGPITQQSYDSPNLLVATTGDKNWAYGFATNGSTDFYTQLKFYGFGSATRGVKILDTNSSNTWVFDGTGNLTLPGNTLSINFANGSAALGNVASLNLDGNASNILYGNGSFAAAPAGGSYGNSNVATFLASYGSNTISTTGNITAGNINATTGIANVANVYMNSGYIETPASAGINIVPGGTAGTRVWSKLVPNANTAFSLGSTSEYWANGYIGNVIGVTANISGNITAANFIGALANSNSNVAIATANGNVVTTVNAATVLTVYQSGIKIGGSGIIQSPGGATSITVNNNGFSAPQANLSQAVNLTAGNMNLNSGTTFLGDFSNATLSSRTLFTTSATNSNAGIYVAPSGTATAASWQAVNANSLTNASKILIATNGSTDVQLVSGINGTGTYLPLSFYNNNVSQMRLYPSGGFYVGQTQSDPGTNNLQVQGNVTANNFTGNINITGNVTGTSANVTLVAGVYSTVFDNTGNATFPGIIATSGNINATGLQVGNGAVGNCAVALVPATGTAANMAFRDYSTPNSIMYFDTTVGSANTGGAFTFRGSSSFTQYANINQYGVTQPTKPAFRVYGSVGTNIGAGTTVTSTQGATVDYNQGSYYNNATGLFTAPVAGIYSCTATIRVGSTSGLNQASIQKNNNASGSNVVAFWEVTGNSASNGFGHMSMTGMTKLAVGDTLRLQVISGNINFDPNDSWAVTFIG